MYIIHFETIMKYNQNNWKRKGEE